MMDIGKDLQNAYEEGYKQGYEQGEKDALYMAIEALSEKTSTIQEKHQLSEETPTNTPTDAPTEARRKEREMSYDLRVSVKVEGCDEYADIGYPEYDHPTYNLRDMFKACMDWDYSQGEYYPCSEYVKKLERGIMELKFHREDYEKYNPSNGWGSIDSALKALESWWKCIQEQAEIIPMDCLYIRW